MRHLAVAIFLLVGLTSFSFGQITLSLVNPTTNLPADTVTPGGTFIFDIEVTGLTASDPLDAFNIGLANSSTGTTLPGFTVSFSNVHSGFDLGGPTKSGYGYDTAADSTSNDITQTTPVILLTATFTAASTLVPTIPPTSYSIDFTGAGTQLYYYNSPTKTDVLIPLATSSPTQVPSYTQLDGTVLVTQAPEPKSLTLILLILGFFISFQVLGKFKPAPAANLSA